MLIKIVFNCFDLPSMWVKFVYTSEAVLDLSALSIDLFGFLFLAWHQWQVIMSANIINNINSSGTDILSDYLLSTILSICLQHLFRDYDLPGGIFLAQLTGTIWSTACIILLPHTLAPKTEFFEYFPPYFLSGLYTHPAFPRVIVLKNVYPRSVMHHANMWGGGGGGSVLN